MREFFYWYIADEFIEVSDEAAEELRANKRYEFNCWQRSKRNKANYSLDTDDGIKNAVCEHEPSPEEWLALAETYTRLCHALNALSPIQGWRVDTYYLQGMSFQAIAQAEGVDESSVRKSIERALENMRKGF